MGKTLAQGEEEREFQEKVQCEQRYEKNKGAAPEAGHRPAQEYTKLQRKGKPEREGPFCNWYKGRVRLG